jgi:hypothetical protein
MPGNTARESLINALGRVHRPAAGHLYRHGEGARAYPGPFDRASGYCSTLAHAADGLTPLASNRRLAMYRLASAARAFARTSFFAIPR